MKFDHIHVKCRDLDKAVEFYERIFDSKVIARQAIRGTPVVRLNLGGVVLNLSAVAPEENFPDPPKREKIWDRRGLGHVGVMVEDLEKTVREMKARGAEFLVEPREAMPGTRIAFVRGPEEDTIEIVQRDQPLPY
jgi:catechol 2,3-dioxygenase-like lactoylglutathione lyase family enzyme